MQIVNNIVKAFNNQNTDIMFTNTRFIVLSLIIRKTKNHCFASFRQNKTVCVKFAYAMFIKDLHFVRLSLLTMTHTNQLRDVLLFVCSKMADETSLSSKLPVADRTRGV